jgi:peptidoglycan/xylan/chitin deacetylase (PgdA/CDA1 family)
MLKIKWLYDSSAIGKVLFPSFLWETVNNKILFTFDDGPNPSTTPKILNLLSKFGKKAIFFVVGENAQKYPDLLKEIVIAGHSVGNHTFNHRVVTKLTYKELEEQISLTNKTVEDITGVKLEYFRPPKGKLNFSFPKKIKNYSLINVMWNLSTYDYKNDLNIVKFALKNYLKPKSILGMHDSQKNSKIVEDSIRFAVELAEEKGFQFGEPSECLK